MQFNNNSKFGKKALNLPAMLIKTLITIIVVFLFVFYIVAIANVNYDDRETVVNLIFYNFAKDCLESGTYFDHTAQIVNGELKCLNTPNNVYIQGKYTIEGVDIIFFSGNKALESKIMFCDSKGSIFCKTQKYLTTNTNSNTGVVGDQIGELYITTLIYTE